MMKVLLMLALCFTVVSCTMDRLRKDNAYPEQVMVIRNPRLEVEILNPNLRTRHHGPRFEWLGLVSQVTLDGENTFFRSVSPDEGARAAWVGLAEETGMFHPPGYDEAEVGEGFVKIGIGVLQRTGDEDYFFGADYPILDAPPIEVVEQESGVSHIQRLDGPRGWGYRYVKTIELHPDEPVLYIHHTLINTGDKSINCTQYNHNFFRFNHADVGPGHVVEFTFEPSVSLRPDGDEPELHGIVGVFENRLEFLSDFKDVPAIFVPLTDFGEDPEYGTVTVKNTDSGTGVTASGDFPLDMLHFYANSETLCPEMFIRLDIQPGRSRSWTRKYRFVAGE